MLKNTSSRPIPEVKQHWARLVLGWETAWEPLVQLASFLSFNLGGPASCEALVPANPYTPLNLVGKGEGENPGKPWHQRSHRMLVAEHKTGKNWMGLLVFENPATILCSRVLLIVLGPGHA